MKEGKIISSILNVIAIIIILLGFYVFIDYRLWKRPTTDFVIYLKIFVPILVLGFSCTLYGIASLLNKDK